MFAGVRMLAIRRVHVMMRDMEKPARCISYEESVFLEETHRTRLH
jgi:hypothetical protein